jgi:hypothetical protein
MLHAMRELTKQTLQFFSERDSATPPEYASAVGHYPIRAAYTWLDRLRKRYFWLRRGMNVQGRLTYQLTGQGARRLLYLKHRQRV